MGNTNVRTYGPCLSRDAPQRASVYPSVSLVCPSHPLRFLGGCLSSLPDVRLRCGETGCSEPEEAQPLPQTDSLGSQCSEQPRRRLLK